MIITLECNYLLTSIISQVVSYRLMLNLNHFYSRKMVPQGGTDKNAYVTGHEKIGLMCTQNLTTFLDFKLE